MSGDTTDVRDINIYKPYLDLIVAGRKTVEVRVAYASMRRIQPGTLLRFRSGDDQCLTRVERVTEYSSFAEMLEHEEAGTIGDTDDPEELLAKVREIYPPKKEALGVLAIGITPV